MEECLPITQGWYAIDTVTVTTTSNTQKDITADVYMVVKDDLKATIGLPSVAEVSHAEFFQLEKDRKALKRP